jgi:hypothetical protein
MSCSEKELTGKIRYRSNFFGKLILEVETVQLRTRYDPYDGSETTKEFIWCWRDANLYDLQELNIKEGE